MDEEMRDIKRHKLTPAVPQEPAAPPAPPQRTHVIASGETLSHLALKYYGSATQEKWMIIYEANKELIGDNPNKVRVGMELVIPDAE